VPADLKRTDGRTLENMNISRKARTSAQRGRRSFDSRSRASAKSLGKRKRARCHPAEVRIREVRGGAFLPEIGVRVAGPSARVLYARNRA